MYRLFLSHSSPDAPAKERLQALAAAIKNAARPGEIEVLYDAEQIAVADEWRERIAFMLHVCDGAAVLLDEAAVESKWVLAEATFASLRHAYDKNFACVPISFLDDADLKAAQRQRQRQRDLLRESDWSVAALPDIQFAQGKDVPEIADAVVGALRAKGQLHTNNPIDRLADDLATLLRDAPNSRVNELATEVDHGDNYLSSDRGCRAGLALVQKMLQALSLYQVRKVLDGFGLAFERSDVRKILDLLSPLVLPIEASEMLHRRRDTGGYAHASMCVENAGFFIGRYVQRAHLSRRPPPCLAIANTYGTVEELQARLRDSWRAEQSPGLPRLTDEQTDKSLKRADGVYVWVPGPVDDAVMIELETLYPTVGFIVHHTHDDAPDAWPPHLPPIRPALTADEETEIIMDYQDAMISLGEGT